MPVFGLTPEPELPQDPAVGIDAELTIEALAAPRQAIVWDAFPLTFDESFGGETSQASPEGRSLHDIVQGNEWRLRRIIGKCFVGAGATTTLSTISSALVEVGFGFIVVRTYDDGSPTTDFNEVNPLSQDSMEDPWIWRRVWMLNPFGSPYPTDTTTPRANTLWTWDFPQTNARYGSVLDGPHIDAKTARVIHRQERLFGVLAVRRNYMGFTPTTDLDYTVRMHLDYRLLGSLRGTSYGNRRNTSR